MGLIISRFRKKQTTEEILDGIDKRVTELQKFRWRNQQLKKQYIGSLILYSILLYILAALIFYFYYLPDTWRLRLLYSIPLLIFPVLVWLFKRFLHWYFVKRIASNDIELEEICSKKKQILEDVMEKETYKKAKEILEKYDPDRFKKVETPVVTPRVVVSPGSTGVRQRLVGSRPPTPQAGRGRGLTPGTTPRLPQGRGTPIQPRQIMSPGQNGQPMSPYNRPPGPPLPRPVLPRERGKMDKLVEYFVGDGPQNRYALICRCCHSHNGMALKEEFEYLTFRCCYCYQLNPARKQRPFAPKIDFAAPSTSTGLSPPRPVAGQTPGPPRSAQAVPANKDTGAEADEETDEGETTDEEESGEEDMEGDKTTTEEASKQDLPPPSGAKQERERTHLQPTLDTSSSATHAARLQIRLKPAQSSVEDRSINGEHRETNGTLSDHINGHSSDSATSDIVKKTL